MAEQKYVKFITALINATKNDTIEWSYLDSNKLLCQGMHWVKATTFYDNLVGNTSPTPDFNVESSFYTSQDDGYIALYVYGNEPAELFIIPGTFKSVVHMSADQYGEYITRLLNIVHSKFPSGDAMIDQFMGSNGIDIIEEI